MKRLRRGEMPLLRGLRSSILDKVLLAFLVAILLASGVTALLESRLTRSALDGPALQLVASHLSILERTYAERERVLAGTLRNTAQSLQARGLTDPARRDEIVTELGRTLRNLGIDLLQLADTREPARATLAGVGLSLSASPVDISQGVGSGESRLLATRQGPVVQAVAVPVGAASDGLVLVGGYEFADAFAYRLRAQVGDVGHVVLVTDARVAGSTLTSSPAGHAPPGANDGELPKSPVAVVLDGEENLVHYASLGDAGALGVVLPDPVAPLGRALGRNRLLVTAVLALVALALGGIFFRALTRPLVRLAGTADRIARGDLEAPFHGHSKDEIGRLAAALDEMRFELRSQWSVIVSQAAELREGSKRVVAAQDDERRRLARDLHDGIQQHLVLLRMAVGMAHEPVPLGAGPAGPTLANLGDELDLAIERLRQVSQDLYPSILVDLGLRPALQSLVGRLPLSSTMACRPDPLPRLPGEVENGAYFLACEAVTNVLKHSGASEVAISLEIDSGWLILSVADNGQGFRAREKRGDGGLLHMEDRARSFGGKLTIASAPGQGTKVSASFPVDGIPLSPAPAAERTAPPPPGG